MIRKIGIIIQGPNDRGFLLGLRDRLGCEAEPIEARVRGRNKLSVWRDALANWRYFQRCGTDVVIRLTDSGTDRWQDVKREELSRFPDEMRPLLICGVTEGDVELWLSADRAYLENELSVPASETISDRDMVGRIKSAIKRHPHARQYDQVVRHLVTNAPREVFRRWLARPSLHDLYVQCRDAARREGDCPATDELE